MSNAILFLGSVNEFYDHAPKVEIEELWRSIGKQAIEVEVFKKDGRTDSEKIDTVKELKEKGIGIEESCELFGISRSNHGGYIKDHPLKKAKTERCLEEEELLKQIEAIKSCHPFSGYRRVTAFLKRRLDIGPNHKRIYGIMRKHNVAVPQGKRNETCTGSVRSRPRAKHSNDYWRIGMTKFMVESIGWAYLVGVF